MEIFEMYDPQSRTNNYRLLKLFERPIGRYTYYFLNSTSHLVVYSDYLHIYPETAGEKAGTTKLFRYQFEMPFEGVRWFIDVIEQKFFKSPHEGGLPANKLSYEEIVSGEDLHVMRTLGGGDRPGYVITNGSRRSHISGSSLQELEFSDRWLFHEGLMDYLKELADKYEQGTL